MTKPLTNEQRVQKADQVADTGTLVSNMLGVRSLNGRTLVDLMNEAEAAEIRAANYQGSGSSGSERPDPAYAAMNADLPAEVAAQRARVRDFDHALTEAARWIEQAFEIGRGFLPREARPKEAQSTALEEANRDAGCESCARVRTSSGDKTWRKTWRTGRVASKPKGEVEAAKREKGRQRRALLTSEEDENEALARLDKPRRLCRSCYEHVEKLPAGVGVTMAYALPLAWVRDMLARQAQKKSAENAERAAS